MGVGALALVLAGLALIAASFAGRLAGARALGVRDIGIFGVRRGQGGVSVSALRRLGAHAGACLGAYAVAVALFTLAFQVAGESFATTAIEVLPGMPGEQAGLKDGDTITRVDGETITDWEQMHNAIKRRPNQPAQVEIRRNGQPQTLEVTPNGEGRIGVKPVVAAGPMGLGRAARGPSRGGDVARSPRQSARARWSPLSRKVWV